MGNDKIHDKRICDLVQHPHILNIDDVVLSATEVNMFRDGNLIGQPDVMYVTRYGNIHTVEYKCRNSHPERAFYQLRKAEKFLKETFDLTTEMFYVYGKYDIHKL